MKRTKHSFKVLSTLSLAASDAREDTLTSVVINTLYEANKLKEGELADSIEVIYEFQPHKSELASLIIKLKEKGIIINGNGLLSLSDKEKERLNSVELLQKDSENKRFQNFKSFLVDKLHVEIEIIKVKLLYNTFIEYLYNSFYEFGEDAIENFLPKKDKVDLDNEDFLQSSYSKLVDKNLCSIFKNVIDKFPDNITKDDLEFLNDIALKTQSFASLGVAPEAANEVINLNLVDWVLYLDTNVLYSLLDLHAHSENESCKALIKLIIDNQEFIKINLRYSDLTLKELLNKKSDFNYLDSGLTDSSIRGILNSDKLDEFSRQFYSNVLTNRKSALHPSKIIELANVTLQQEKITISRNKARIEHLGEAFLNERTNDYLRYVDQRNQNKLEYCKEKKIPFNHPYHKSEKQAWHDITLRELILDQRISSMKKHEIFTFNNVKYFAVTLDELLLQYDQNLRFGHTDERSFPIFFKPSFLLSKLVKILPVKTSDYKRAFFKALTARGFNKNIKRSEDIIKIAHYLKQRGIDNEEVINNLISEDLFLEKFKDAKVDPAFNEGQFIEDEINKQFTKKQEALIQIQDELNSTKSTALEFSSENSTLHKKFEELKNQLDLYAKANQSLSFKVKKMSAIKPIVINQMTMPLQGEKDDIGEVTQLKVKLLKQVEEEIETFRIRLIKNWKRKIWWNLFWVLPLSTFTIVVIVKPVLFGISDPNATRLLVAFITLILDGLFLFLIKARYWDEKNIETKKNNFPLLPELRKKLAEAKV